MKFLALIQARCGSSRLPNKVLKEFSGKTNIEWVVERVKRSSRLDEVMVITSIGKENLPLIQACTKMDTRVFVGSENDVLDRYYQAAKLLKPEYIIRITADCPVFDWTYLDMAIDSLCEGTDYMADFTESFPDGLDIEIIRYEALEKAWEDARLLSEREHVTLYIRNNRELFKIQDLRCPIEGISNKRWTMDEEEDYLLIKNIYEYFISQGRTDFRTDDILEYLKDNPQLEELNKKYARNEGLAKSLREDKVID